MSRRSATTEHTDIESNRLSLEGAWNADGKGESIWDRFTHSVGKIKGGGTGDIACDEYHLYPQEIAVL